jgi:ABC-type antimicrobial peptide transport system permease subunit
VGLGASRPRVIRQLLTESALISVIGGPAGLLAASWILRMLYHVLLARPPEEFSPFLNLELDYRIFGLTLLAAIGAGVAAGPASEAGVWPRSRWASGSKRDLPLAAGAGGAPIQIARSVSR